MKRLKWTERTGGTASGRSRSLPCPHHSFQLIMGLIGAFQIFTESYILAGGKVDGSGSLGGPEQSLLFYAVNLYQEAFVFLKMGYASALAWILFIIVLLITFILLKRRAAGSITEVSNMAVRLRVILPHAVLLLFAVIFLFPFVWLVMTSLKTPEEILEFPPSIFRRRSSGPIIKRRSKPFRLPAT